MEQLKIAGGKNRKITPSENLSELINNCPKSKIIGDNLIRAWHIINSQKYKKIVCSISGGSDSDIMLDICYRCDKNKKIDYVWFDTGLEYQATKDHLNYLEEKYNIEILKYKAIKSIPMSCKTYGQPFISKKHTVNRLFQRMFLSIFIDFKNMNLIGMIISTKNYVVNIKNAIPHYNGGVMRKVINHSLTFLKINILKNLS